MPKSSAVMPTLLCFLPMWRQVFSSRALLVSKTSKTAPTFLVWSESALSQATALHTHFFHFLLNYYSMITAHKVREYWEAKGRRGIKSPKIPLKGTTAVNIWVVYFLRIFPMWIYIHIYIHYIYIMCIINIHYKYTL